MLSRVSRFVPLGYYLDLVQRDIFLSPREFSIVGALPLRGTDYPSRIGRLVIYYPHAIDIFPVFFSPRAPWAWPLACVL